MSDLRLPEDHGFERDIAFAERMNREVAKIGARLATLLEQSPVLDDHGLDQGRMFLTAMFRSTVVGGSDVLAVRASELHPIDRLARALSLSPIDLDLVMLAAMADAHEGYASVLRNVNPRSEPRATAGLAAQLGCSTGRDRVVLMRTLEDGNAVRSGLIALAGECPFFEKNLMLADGLWPVLCGIDTYPASLKRVTSSAAQHGLSQWLASPEIAAARRAIAADAPRVVLLSAETETIALHRAAALVASCGHHGVCFDITAGSGAFVRLAVVHALARGAVPIFRVAVSDSPSSTPMPDLDGCTGPVVVCTRRGSVDIAGRLPVIAIEASALSATSRERMWRDTLPELAGRAIDLASRYALEPAMAADVATDVRARHSIDGTPIDVKSVADSVRVRSNSALAAGVRIVRPTACWEHLVLPQDRKALLVEALNRLVHQRTVFDGWRFLEGRPGARGVRLLLSGPPGTGKTLSAEVMAASLDVDLMVVDVSRVVSKWLGETEKHLAAVFDVAERAQAVLLFDEADALFGKRTEVSDAHDRYANLETAYLLSRLERFEGLAILSTNLKHNVDPAFLRRVEFAIEFDEPAATERHALWRSHLPPQAPLGDDVNLAELAGLYPIVGGLIRNASVAAGFLAAAANAPIGQSHLVGAIRREYDKSAKAFPGAPVGVVPV